MLLLDSIDKVMRHLDEGYRMARITAAHHRETSGAGAKHPGGDRRQQRGQ